MAANSSPNNSSSGMEYFVLGFLILFAIHFLWIHYLPLVSWIIAHLLYPWFSYTEQLFSSSNLAAHWMRRHDPHRYTTSEIIALLTISGMSVRFIVCPVLFIFAIHTFMNSVRRKYTRRMNFYTLAQVQSRTFLMILPAVRSELKGTFRVDSADPWCSALPVHEFVERYQLYQKKSPTGHYYLDDKKIWKHYAAELTPWVDVNEIPRVRRLMLAIFIEWILDGYDDANSARGGGSPLIYAANIGFWPYELTGNAWAKYWFLRLGCDSFPQATSTQFLNLFLRKKPKMYMETSVFDQADRFLNKKEAQKILAGIIKNYAFLETGILALWEKANEYMKLPTASFIWLRPLDRALWYGLNSMGRPGAWPESNGIVCHYRYEVINGRTEIPFIDPSVIALHQSLNDLDYEDMSHESIQEGAP